MLRVLSIILFLFTGISLWANDVIELETNPRNPVKGEVFQILFRLNSASGEEPEISFDPVGFEVLGKQMQGLSTKTIYHMGKITTRRELLISYDARASKAGLIQLKNIVVKVDGRVEREAQANIQVFEAAPEPRLVFIAADVPKRSVYEGEGFMVRYYLYRKTNLQAFDIKKYPKLTGFMKRFMQENDSPQRVTVDGDLFQRSVIYSARVYPERPGKLLIDPMEITATYAQDMFGNMGFGFGLGMRDMKTKLMSSEPLEIEVKPLPEAGKPEGFSGLVGQHSFDLKLSRNQVLVNEPLEIKLTVTGPGNLENLSPPRLIEGDELEQFEARADLNLMGTESAAKTFDYTYLARGGGELPVKSFNFSFFDPQSQRYEVVKLELPGITVVGEKRASAPTQPRQDEPTKSDVPPEIKTPSGPHWATSLPWWNQMSFWWSLSALALLALAVFKGRSIFLNWAESAGPLERELKALERGSFTSAELLRILFTLSPSARSGIEALKTSSLDAPTQEHFRWLLESLELQEFKGLANASGPKVNPSSLKKLKKALRGVHAKPL